MNDFVRKQPSLWIIRPSKEAAHPNQSKCINNRLFAEKTKCETTQKQESQSKDVHEIIPAPFCMFAARVSPKEKNTKYSLPTDARETTQESTATLEKLLTNFLGKIQSTVLLRISSGWIVVIVGMFLAFDPCLEHALQWYG